jgi:hypothetical protein
MNAENPSVCGNEWLQTSNRVVHYIHGGPAVDQQIANA